MYSHIKNIHVRCYGYEEWITMDYFYVICEVKSESIKGCQLLNCNSERYVCSAFNFHYIEFNPLSILCEKYSRQKFLEILTNNIKSYCSLFQVYSVCLTLCTFICYILLASSEYENLFMWTSSSEIISLCCVSIHSYTLMYACMDKLDGLV